MGDDGEEGRNAHEEEEEIDIKLRQLFKQISRILAVSGSAVVVRFIDILVSGYTSYL